ncbi:hypothetical protein HER32_18640 [Hymenobacter sp. BT18]|uniref:TaqI-like C-terminal specificity domain-containing protein n=1 Tax=Hymenobacter sp. BT18 TaxID=2835648 RepID=UPI00143E34B2|nr:TaqI-like C-terminal specificity domain-containing protein [Hymenobacter sp. BT18]QIX63080.1 hypothetical protein HER32_18640 [Hymenobacter sp. BT18]
MIDFGDLPIFADALTYVSIFTLKNNSNKEVFPYIKVKSIDDTQNMVFDKLISIDINIDSLSGKPWVLATDSKKRLFDKLEKFHVLGNIGNAWAGLFTGLDEVMMLDKQQVENLALEQDILLPLIRGNDPKRFAEATPSMFVIYPYKMQGAKTVALDEDELALQYPVAYRYLIDNKKKLGLRKDSRKTFADRKDWFGLTRFGQKKIFESQKIVSPGEVKEHKFSLDNTGAGFSCARVFAVTVDDIDYSIKYVLALLNSRISQFFLQSFSSPKQGGYYTYSSGVLNKTPIPNISPAEQQPFIDLADQLLTGHRALHAADADFGALLRAELGLAAPLTGKLALTQEWKAWSTALQKSLGRPLALKEKAEWLRHFEAHQRQQAQQRQHLHALDRELDQLVYQLYQLTPEEIALVEGR